MRTAIDYFRCCDCRCMISKLRKHVFYYCRGRATKMSAVPQGAFNAIKIRQNMMKQPKKGGEDDFPYFSNNALSPLQYNSKLMNSVWGMYNRYSVHNLKKIMDDTIVANHSSPRGAAGSEAIGEKKMAFTPF